MNLIELQHSLRQLRLGGMAAVLETRLHQAQVEPMAPIDLLATLVNDELTRRSDRLLERRRKQANFRDPGKTLDNFDFSKNLPRPRSTARASSTWSRSPLSPCSSLTTSECGSCRRPPPRISSRSSCAAMNAPVRC